MGKQAVVELQFPAKGLNKAFAFQSQPPYTTPDCLNVRAFDQAGGRARGGSRPGLSKHSVTQLGGGDPVRLLSSVRAVYNDGLTAWIDTFDGTALSTHWSTAAWAAAAPGILGDIDGAVSTSTESAAVVRTLLTPFDTTQAYQIDILVVPYDGAYHGTYQIFAGLSNTSPDNTQDGVTAEITITGTTGVYSGTLTSTASGVDTEYAMTSGTTGAAIPAFFSLLVSGTTVTAYWNGTSTVSKTVTGLSESRFGFGLVCTEAGGAALADMFRIQYRKGITEQKLRDILVASSNGTLYKTTYAGTFGAVSGNLTLNTDRRINAAERAQKLYIADWGNPRVYGADGVRGTANNKLDAASVADWTAKSISVYNDVCVISSATGDLVNGTYTISSVASGEITLGSAIATGVAGTCSYRIVRAPKVYDPVADTLTLWTATVGTVPHDNPLVCRWRDRLVLAGDITSPHMWYMSRSGDALDWTYSTDVDDATRPVAGNNSDAGTPGEPITALISHSDDYLLMGCQSSLWLLRGDPATAVSNLDKISDRTGVRGSNAWCQGGSGEIYILGTDGLYRIMPGAEEYCVPLSHDKLPAAFSDVDSGFHVELAYDHAERGIHIFMVGDDGMNRLHYWFDLKVQGFWPVQVPENYEPLSMYATDINGKPVCLLGCRDGYVRKFDTQAETDDGTSITNYVLYGPMRLGRSGFHEGGLRELAITLSENSSGVTCYVLPGDSAETSVGATPVSVGTFTGGRNCNARPNRRGAAVCLKLAGGGLRRWTVETVSMRVESAGRQLL